MAENSCEKNSNHIFISFLYNFTMHCDQNKYEKFYDYKGLRQLGWNCEHYASSGAMSEEAYWNFYREVLLLVHSCQTKGVMVSWRCDGILRLTSGQKHNFIHCIEIDC